MWVSQCEQEQVLRNLASKVREGRENQNRFYKIWHQKLERKGDQNLTCTPTFIQTDSFEEEMEEEGHEA